MNLQKAGGTAGGYQGIADTEQKQAQRKAEMVGQLIGGGAKVASAGTT